MLYVRVIVGIAMLLMAAFGPGIGVRPGTKVRRGNDEIGQGNAPATRTGKRDEKMAAVVILRILSAIVGFWLLFFSISQLIHAHGHM